MLTQRPGERIRNLIVRVVPLERTRPNDGVEARDRCTGWPQMRQAGQRKLGRCNSIFAPEIGSRRFRKRRLNRQAPAIPQFVHHAGRKDVRLRNPEHFGTLYQVAGKARHECTATAVDLWLVRTVQIKIRRQHRHIFGGKRMVQLHAAHIELFCACLVECVVIGRQCAKRRGRCGRRIEAQQTLPYPVDLAGRNDVVGEVAARRIPDRPAGGAEIAVNHGLRRHRHHIRNPLRCPQSFIAHEKERAVFLYRPAQVHAELIALERR